MQRILLLLLTLALVLTPYIARASDEAPCGPDDVVQNRKPPLHFEPFDRVNPETGEHYHPNDLIEITKEDGTIQTYRAQDYFDQLDETERMLNEWGYSLREDGAPTLSRLNYCRESMAKQAALIDKAVRSEQAKFLEGKDEWLKRWNAMKDEYVKALPSWEELYRKADSDEYKIYMPEVPVYHPPRPTFQRREIEFHKEKSYSLLKGSNKNFSVELRPYYKLGATKVEAKGEAGIKVNGGLVGRWQGEIASLKILAHSPGSGPLKVDLVASVINGKKTWSKSLVNKGSLRYYDDVRASEAYEVTYRFAVGPIPMAGQVGIRGEVGFQWGLELYPLQIGAFTGPFAAVDAYAQVGADIGVAGVGVGGRLRVAEYSLMLQGNVLFTYVEEPEITLNLALTSDLTLLAGDLYAYAYIKVPVLWPPWSKRFEWRHVFFEWEGFHKTGTLFDYRAKYGRDGLVAEGDLSAEDILEMKQLNRVAYVEQLESMAAEGLGRVGEISAWLNNDGNRSILAHAEALNDAALAQKSMVDEFWKRVQGE